MRPLLLLVSLALAGCGADGEPIKPSAKVNIGLGPNGITTSVSTGARVGPVTLTARF